VSSRRDLHSGPGHLYDPYLGCSLLPEQARRLLLGSSLLIVAIACVLPFTILGSISGSVHLPVSFSEILAGLVIGYQVIVELLWNPVV
jgi:hypothetical protein